MTRITRWLWSPDTCGCQIYTLVDADLPPDQQVERAIEVAPNTVQDHELGTVRCIAHASHADPEEHHKVVLEECNRKNITHGHLSDGEIIMSWHWTGDSPNRVLHVKSSEAKPEKGNKQQLQKKMDDSFGIARVVLE